MLHVFRRIGTFLHRKMDEAFKSLLGLSTYRKSSAFSPLLILDAIVIPSAIYVASTTTNEALRQLLECFIGGL